MKKFNFNKKYFDIAMLVLIVIVSAIIFEKVLSHFDVISSALMNVCSTAIKILSPFIFGFCIAYLLNPGVRSLETKIKKYIPASNKKKNLSRILSIVTVYVIFAAFLGILVPYILREVFDSIAKLIINLSSYDYYALSDRFLSQILPGINETFNTNYTEIDIVNMILTPMLQALSGLPDVFSKVMTSTVNFAGVLINFLMGIMIAFYMLCDKENFSKMCRKFLVTIFPKKTSDKIIYVAKISNETFERFFIGKIIDSSIIGVIFFIVCLFLKAPYAILLSLIIGVTNMIPYFGPFIGAVPVVLIVLITNPLKALWLAIAILILQQIDGIIIGPKILGDSTGLKPIDVMFAIIVGGALFGVVGMFIGVPVFAVIKIMVSAIIDRRYDKKIHEHQEASEIESKDNEVG